MSAKILGDYKFPLFPLGVLVYVRFWGWNLLHIGTIRYDYRNGRDMYIFSSCISPGLRWELKPGHQTVTIVITGEEWSCFQPLDEPMLASFA